MAIKLKQSTASQEIPLGYFVDSTDGNTEETGLTIANTDIKLWKMGATALANKNSGGATHISNGIYYAVLDATDTDTLGALVVFVHVAGALAVRVECEVLAANVYDSLIAASDKLQVHADEMTAGLITATVIATGAIDADAIADGAIDAGAIAADAITAAKIADGAIDANTFAAGAITAAAIAADAIGASELAADAVTEIQNGLATAANLATVAGYIDTEVASILAAVDTEIAALDTKLGTPAGASISADIAAIEAQTDDIGAAGAGLTAVPWNASWDAEVQSEVQDALDATIPDSVPADGSRPSIPQALLMIARFLMEKSVSGTTVTVKKEDGSTSSMTFTLDSSTDPTSITRAT